jgi:hypothetical protein
MLWTHVGLHLVKRDEVHTVMAGRRNARENEAPILAEAWKPGPMGQEAVDVGSMEKRTGGQLGDAAPPLARSLAL